ncbi:spore germination protein [Aquibacillus salsiterrae]|uniref:Spore germination protein n=1 Tax=Aquibacillus salsiterrae TaxID=2950439 RepID=A0A9X4ADY8_9BACI|nr:spore germination protein [Aquibacillus salsiterrae]MDC3415869.1 spore germination protein [Aquibacillus salsiterrae]
MKKGIQLRRVKVQKKQQQKEQQQNNTDKKNKTPIPLSTNIDQNIQTIKQDLGNSADIVIRKMNIGSSGNDQIAICYTNGLVDTKTVQNVIIKTLLVDIREAYLQNENKSKLSELFENHTLPGGEITKVTDLDNSKHDLLSGNTILLINGESVGFSIDTKGWASRSIEEPSTQTVVRGPKEGFVESLRTNTALVRRKIKSEDLWIEQIQIGQKTKTDIAILYMNGIVNQKILDEVKTRLKRVQVDGIFEGGSLEELIQDETFTPFPTIYNTERPDSAASNLLEGRVVIIIDGTPFALVAPALFVQFLQSSEDYYQRADMASFLRLLRFVAFMLALLIPSSYIAVTTFHQDMLPTTLLVSLAAQREGVPFPAFIEALLMEIVFEILREAGVRMPRAIGSAISIVGALVLGQAAVDAGIVSNVMVIVVSITAISSFVIPEYNLAIAVRLLRFFFMLLAASFGMFGIIIGLIMMVIHLTSLRSFGVPYLSPMAPFNKEGQKDSLIRLPQWALFSRPKMIAQDDYIREETPAPEPKNSEDLKGEGE